MPSLADGRSKSCGEGEVGSVTTDVPGIGGDAVDIRSAQKLAWENKLAKGFNTTEVPLEFCLLSGELAEAFDAWRKGRQDVAEELADTAIFLLGLAEMIGADLQDAVEAKLAANEARVYRRLSNGVLVKEASANPQGVRRRSTWQRRSGKTGKPTKITPLPRTSVARPVCHLCCCHDHHHDDHGGGGGVRSWPSG